MDQKRARALTAAKIWYGMSFGSWAFVFPFLNLYYRSVGYSASQIGVVSALRPWVAAPAGQTWCAVADRFKCHRTLLTCLHTAAVLLVATLSVRVTPYAWLLTVVVLAEVCKSPIAILADAAVSAATTDSGQYGKCRLWGAVTWGGVGIFSGSLVDAYGMALPFGVFTVCGLSAVCVILFGLDFSYLVDHALEAPRVVALDLEAAPPEAVEVKARATRDAACSRELGGSKWALNVRSMASLEAEDGATQQHDGAESNGGIELAAAGARRAGQRPSDTAMRETAELLRAETGQAAAAAAGGAACVSATAGDRAAAGEVDAETQPLLTSAPASEDPWRECSTSTPSTPVHVSSSGLQLEHGRCDRRGDVSHAKEQLRAHFGRPPNGAESRARPVQGRRAPHSRDKLALFSKPEVLLFLFRALLMGFGMGVVEGFMFIRVEQLGGSKRLMSLGITFTCVSEVPIFHYSGAIVDALGALGSLNLVLAAFVVRLSAYATMALWPTLWLLLPVELLHGVTFGLAWATGTVYSKQVAPPGLNTTVQGAFQSCYFGLGTGLGGLVGGLLFQHAGPVLCFVYAAAIVLAGSLVCAALTAVIVRQDTPTRMVQSPLS